MILELVGHFLNFTKDLFLAIESLFRQFVSIEIMGYAPLWLVLCTYVAVAMITVTIVGIFDAMEDDD